MSVIGVAKFLHHLAGESSSELWIQALWKPNDCASGGEDKVCVFWFCYLLLTCNVF